MLLAVEVGIVLIGYGGWYYLDWPWRRALWRSKTGKRSVDWCNLIGYGGGHSLDCLWRLTLFGLAMEVGIIGFGYGVGHYLDCLWRLTLF